MITKLYIYSTYLNVHQLINTTLSKSYLNQKQQPTFPQFNCQPLHFSHKSRTSNGGQEAEWLCILLFFNYNASSRGVPPAKFLVEVLSC